MRLFVAVWPPAEVVEALRALPRPALERLRWTTSDQWHVTLLFLGQVDDLDGARRALGRVEAGSLGPAVAKAGPATATLGPGVLCLPVGGLGPLAKAVAGAMAEMGQPEDRPFRGHLTLARRQGRARTSLASLAGAALAVSWPVDAVTLVGSETHPAGARYRVLESLPLPGTGPGGSCSRPTSRPR